MKHTYYNLETSAVIHLLFNQDTLARDRMAMISSVGVMRNKRGKGYARDLMAEVLRDADREQISLCLGVECQDPVDGLSDEQLTAWYVRCGFDEVEDNFFVRCPRNVES